MADLDLPARRQFLLRAGLLAATTLLPRLPRAAPASAGPADPRLIEDLVAANRILADQGVLDGYGHVSVRHDKDPGRYLLARSVAPELVGAEDILEFDLDSVPVDPRGHKLYLERFIHGEIYRARPDVQAVVHHHSPAVIPFGITRVPLRAVYHMAAFIGQGLPVFEIRDVAGMTDLLVRTPELGRALAATVGTGPGALMRGHGAAIVGASLPEAVGRCVFLQVNARMQAQAMALGGEITYLAPEEVQKLSGTGGYERAWELWRRKALGH